DQAGKLWVAETLNAPRRISVWDTQSGRLVREFFGASHYSTFVCMDPKREDEVYCHMTVWKVDLDRGTWYPHSTMWRRTAIPAAPGRRYNSTRGAGSRSKTAGSSHCSGPSGQIRRGHSSMTTAILMLSLLQPRISFEKAADEKRPTVAFVEEVLSF